MTDSFRMLWLAMVKANIEWKLADCVVVVSCWVGSGQVRVVGDWATNYPDRVAALRATIDEAMTKQKKGG